MLRAMPMKPLILGLMVLVLALGAGPAQASSSSHDASPAPAEGKKDQDPDEDKTVTLPTLIAPVVEGQRLSGYVYLSIRLITASYGDAGHLRDILPLIQDALLRALNDSPIPAAEAETPAAKEAVIKTVKGALGRLGDVREVQDVALADYQNVPF